MSAKAKARVRRTNTTRDLLHRIGTGETVKVLRISRTAGPCIEGHAVIKGPAPGRHRYRVQFAGDPIPRERVIHPDYQRNAERFVEILRDLWRAYDAPDIDDFFPHPTE
jgi:hypothetical protein